MNWDTLQKSAFLGTERRGYESTLPLTTGPDSVGSNSLGSDPPGPETQLLSDAAALALQRKAGRLPAKRTPGDTLTPCPENTKSAATHSPHLRALLENRHHSTLLGQWLDHARRAGLRAPEESLPSLLDYGRQVTDLRPAILAVLGERGAGSRGGTEPGRGRLSL